MRISEREAQRLKRRVPGKTIKDEGGRILFENDKIKERWRSYFCHLMNVENKSG